jgi:thymidine phosphorylase
VLRGNFNGSEDLVELTIELCGWMFLLGGRTATKEEGRILALELIKNGKALERFRMLVIEQGGEVQSIDNLARLPQSAYREEVLSAASGFVTSIECERMGVAGVMLGGGRFTIEDSVDPAVGIVLHKKVGDPVAAGEALCTVHYNSPERFSDAMPVIADAYSIGAQRPPERSLVQKIIQGKSV